MRLNPDCTRAVLLAIENVCDIDRHFESCMDMAEISGGYTHEEILYHAIYCDRAGLLVEFQRFYENEWSVADLSPKGHEFVNNVRDNKMWRDIKGIAEKIGAKSMEAFVQIASNVMTEVIKAQLGLR